MSSTELHQLVFKWPGTEPSSVIVTGTFDQWASSIYLVKVSSGFEGVIQIPWEQKVKYKFIVDGEWRLQDDQPTEVDPGGYVNNIYTAPTRPVIPPSLVEKSSPVEAEKSTAATTNSDSVVAEVVDKSEHAPLPKSLTGTDDLASTVTAHDGVSSALTYVAPGLGAAMHCVGIDPINTPKVAVPTPKSDDDSSLPPGVGTTSPSIVKQSTPRSPSTPDAPVITVPVNGAENTTAASSPPSESMYTLSHFAPEPTMLKTTPFVPKATAPVSETVPTVESETSEEKLKSASEQTPIPVIESVDATYLNNDLTVLSQTATPLSTTLEAEPASTTSVIPTRVQSAADPEPIVAAVIPPIGSNLVTEEKAQTPSSAPDAVDAAVVSEGKVAEPTATPGIPPTPCKKTPTTSSVKDIKDFPSPTKSSSNATDNSSSSSRFNSVRKKRPSMLGKIKKFFHHDKEKRMN